LEVEGVVVGIRGGLELMIDTSFLDAYDDGFLFLFFSSI